MRVETLRLETMQNHFKCCFFFVAISSLICISMSKIHFRTINGAFACMSTLKYKESNDENKKMCS